MIYYMLLPKILPCYVMLPFYASDAMSFAFSSIFFLRYFFAIFDYDIFLLHFDYWLLLFTLPASPLAAAYAAFDYAWLLPIDAFLIIFAVMMPFSPDFFDFQYWFFLAPLYYYCWLAFWFFFFFHFIDAIFIDAADFRFLIFFGFFRQRFRLPIHTKLSLFDAAADYFDYFHFRLFIDFLLSDISDDISFSTFRSLLYFDYADSCWCFDWYFAADYFDFRWFFDFDIFAYASFSPFRFSRRDFSSFSFRFLFAFAFAFWCRFSAAFFSRWLIIFAAHWYFISFRAIAMRLRFTYAVSFLHCLTIDDFRFISFRFLSHFDAIFIDDAYAFIFALLPRHYSPFLRHYALAAMRTFNVCLLLTRYATLAIFVTPCALRALILMLITLAWCFAARLMMPFAPPRCWLLRAMLYAALLRRYRCHYDVFIDYYAMPPDIFYFCFSLHCYFRIIGASLLFTLYILFHCCLLPASSSYYFFASISFDRIGLSFYLFYAFDAIYFRRCWFSLRMFILILISPCRCRCFRCRRCSIFLHAMLISFLLRCFWCFRRCWLLHCWFSVYFLIDFRCFFLRFRFISLMLWQYIVIDYADADYFAWYAACQYADAAAYFFLPITFADYRLILMLIFFTFRLLWCPALSFDFRFLRFLRYWCRFCLRYFRRATSCFRCLLHCAFIFLIFAWCCLLLMPALFALRLFHFVSSLHFLRYFFDFFLFSFLFFFLMFSLIFWFFRLIFSLFLPFRLYRCLFRHTRCIRFLPLSLHCRCFRLYFSSLLRFLRYEYYAYADISPRWFFLLSFDFHVYVDAVTLLTLLMLMMMPPDGGCCRFLLPDFSRDIFFDASLLPCCLSSQRRWYFRCRFAMRVIFLLPRLHIRALMLIAPPPFSALRGFSRCRHFDMISPYAAWCFDAFMLPLIMICWLPPFHDIDMPLCRFAILPFLLSAFFWCFWFLLLMPPLFAVFFSPIIFLFYDLFALAYVYADID